MRYDFLKGWLEKGRYGAVWVLARYLYRVGEDPLISDAVYDSITRSLKAKYYDVFKKYLERTYDEDPIPYKLLEEVGIEPVKFVTKEGRKELYAQLDEEKSLSIDSVTSYDDVFPFFMRFKELKKDLVLSIKMDGINTKMMYVNGDFKIGISRARSGEGFDFTDQLVYVLPLQPDLARFPEIKLTGESYVVKEGIPVLRQKYNLDKYKTSKSSAISMLRVKHDAEDYKYLKTRIFSAEGLCDTLFETYAKLEELGFDVPPYLLVKWEDIPNDLATFQVWLKHYFDVLWEKQQLDDMPADGVVCAVNDLLWNDTVSHQYSNKQIACKFEYWGFEVYKAKVTEIVMEQRRINVSCRVKIEPMFTSDDCEAKIINIFNPGILIENGIKVGEEVFFERNSGAVNILIHGKRLEDILKE